MSYTAAETAAYFANIDLSETKQPILTRTTIAMPFLSLFFVLLRVVSRRYKRIVLGMDDYFLFAAQVGDIYDEDVQYDYMLISERLWFLLQLRRIWRVRSERRVVLDGNRH